MESKGQIENGWKVLGIIFFIIILFVILISLDYLKYKKEVRECCDGGRKLAFLKGQIAGECHYWTFKEHMEGLKGCAVERLNSTKDI